MLTRNKFELREPTNLKLQQSNHNGKTNSLGTSLNTIAHINTNDSNTT